MNRPLASNDNITDVVIVTIISFGWFILGSVQAVASGFPTLSFTDASLLRIILTEVVFGGAALGFLRLRGHLLEPLVPVPSAVGCITGLALYAAGTLVVWPVYLVAKMTDIATQPIEQMIAEANISLPSLLAVSIVNGFYEEIFLIGYLLRALESYGASFAIGVTLLVRVLYHLYQGPVGAIAVLGFGLVVGIYYWKTRNLWPVVFSHIFADLAGFSLT